MKNEREIEMIFNYKTLKKAARNGLTLGNWNGKAVFAASAAKLDTLENGVYYILYDDENKIVSRSADNKWWLNYGVVTESGSVNEYSDGCRTYTAPVKVPAAAASYAPGYDISERPIGDVKLEIDVEATLRRAREMTVESLLDGFLVGVIAKD